MSTTTITPAINGWKKHHCSLAIKVREQKVIRRIRREKKSRTKEMKKRKKTQETDITRARKQREGGQPRTKNWGVRTRKHQGNERNKERGKMNTKGRKQRAKPSFGLVPEFKHNIKKNKKTKEETRRTIKRKLRGRQGQVKAKEREGRVPS